MFKKKHFTTLTLCLTLVMALVGATTVAAATSNERNSVDEGEFICGTMDGVNYIHSMDGGKTWMTEAE